MVSTLSRFAHEVVALTVAPVVRPSGSRAVNMVWKPFPHHVQVGSTLPPFMSLSEGGRD